MATSSSPLAAVQQLQSVVTALAPTLRPQVLPKGAQYGLEPALGLCKTEQQRQELLALIHENKPAGATTVPKAQAEGSEEEDTDEEAQEDGKYLEPQVVGAFDADKRVFSIQGVQWMHERDAVVHEFSRFMELQLESPEAATHIVAHFLEANGHKADDVLLAEQCFNAAFALQTVLRAFPRPPIAIKGQMVELTPETDVATAFAPLFAPAKKAAKAKTGKKHKSIKGGKPQQKKGKKRKNP